MNHWAIGIGDFSRVRESAAVAITASRLLLGIPLLYGIVNDVALALLALGAIVTMDVADGVIARSLGVESARRRLVDAAVDKLLIHSAAIVGVILEPAFLWLYVPFFVRDLALAMGDLWCVVHLKTHIAGNATHRASSIAIALLAVTALTMSPLAVIVVGALACLVNYALLPDYVSTFRTALARGPASRLRIDVTGGLAGGKSPGD